MRENGGDMYGKHFESMYEGSMYGAGIAVFAVWGYVIAKMRSGTVELNPRKLADTLGGSVDEIAAAIEFLKRPDPESRWKTHEGRRLIKEGEFQYFVPSWEKYQRIKNEENRREYNREKQRDRRAKLAGRKERKLPGEQAHENAVNNGDHAEAERLLNNQPIRTSETENANLLREN